MTPDWCAADIVQYFKPYGEVLEPFKGDGIFLRYLPAALWCEIDEGRDFFDWDRSVDWIISNPPYSQTRQCFKHACSLAEHVVFLVPLRNVFSGYGFVKELQRVGGLQEIRLYGTGSRLGFPMGNCIGAIHWSRRCRGPMYWSDQQREKELSCARS